jgi:nucleotide-binding universal stress UspA family protein
MKKVLIATDFSEAAKNALQFAQAFLPESYHLHVLHVYRPEIDPSFAYTGIPSDNFYAGRGLELEAFIEKNTITKGGAAVATKIEKELAIGFPTDIIVEKSKKGFDLIIMGGTGETDLLGNVFGSVSSYVAQNAHCPVLIVPKTIQFNGFKNILYASDYTSVSDQLVKEAVNFSKIFKAVLHFIHVHKNDENPALNISLEDKLFNILFKDGDPDFAFNMASVDANTISEGLNTYIGENDIDLTILVTHHRNFWERILHKSVTKAMAINTNIPILVFHDDDEGTF